MLKPAPLLDRHQHGGLDAAPGDHLRPFLKAGLEKFAEFLPARTSHMASQKSRCKRTALALSSPDRPQAARFRPERGGIAGQCGRTHYS
jgi:hypothetical protein